MKKGKLVGLSVAFLGTVISVGTAFALYTAGFGDNDEKIGFGGFTYHTSNGAFKFLSTLNGGNTGFSVEAGQAALSPDDRTVTYTFQIAAAYGNDSAGMIKQDAILGKLSIEKTGPLANYLTMAAYVDGYESRIEDNAEQNYWAKGDSLAARTLSGEGNTISAYIPSPTSVSQNMAGVANNKRLTVHVTLTLAEMTPQAFTALDEGAYSLSVVYDDVDAAYGRPYIVGDGTNWGLEEEYAMVPNLGASAYEFCFKDLNSDSAHTFSQMKIVKNKGGDYGKDTSNIWDVDGQDHDGKWLNFGAKADNSQNIILDAATTYFVTFKGDNHGGFNVNNQTNNIYQD